MAEDAGERTEQATPKKREEARLKGQVARSSDLNTAVILLASFLALYFSGRDIWAGLALMFEVMLGNLHGVALDQGSVCFYFIQGTLFLLKLFAPFIITVVLAAFFINVVQVGMVFSNEALMPQWSRLDPIAGIRRIFSMRSLVRTAISILKITFVSAVVYFAIKNEAGQLTELIDKGIGEIAIYAMTISFRVGLWIGIALLFLGILDYGYQFWQHERDLRMTKQEVKEELKRMEGDPRIRERRRMIQRQMAMNRMMQKVPKAQVVITNPTHYAVALDYDSESMPAPTVVAKGVDNVALKIIEIAKENRVPLHEDPPLARELFKKVELNQQIPPELFAAVAEVLAFVYGTRKNRRPVGVGK